MTFVAFGMLFVAVGCGWVFAQCRAPLYHKGVVWDVRGCRQCRQSASMDPKSKP